MRDRPPPERGAFLETLSAVDMNAEDEGVGKSYSKLAPSLSSNFSPRLVIRAVARIGPITTC